MTDDAPVVYTPPRKMNIPAVAYRFTRAQARAQRELVDEAAQTVRDNLAAMRELVTDASEYGRAIDNALEAVGAVQAEAAAVLARRIG